MTVILSGQTFTYRERLKELGGRYDGNAKHWKFDFLSKSKVQELRALPGCLVTEDSGHSVKDAEDFIAALRADPPAITRPGSTVFYGDDREYFNRFRDKNPLSFLGFSSLSKFTDFIDQIPDRKRRGTGWETDDFTAKWSGARDMAEALDMARHGWRKGIENAERVANLLTVSHALQRRRKHALAGGTVNVGRLLAGNPVHMVSRPKQPGRKVITLLVQNNGLANIKSESMIARSAVCCALVDLLESNGYSCELISVTTDRTGGLNDRAGDHLTVKLKSAGERVNIADVAFALGHPAFFRRFGFAAIRQADELQCMWHNMGVSTAAFGELEAGEYYMPHLKQNYPGDTIEEMAQAMLPDVLPAGLPIDIGE